MLLFAHNIHRSILNGTVATVLESMGSESNPWYSLKVTKAALYISILSGNHRHAETLMR